jgi:hypothetical protein
LGKDVGKNWTRLGKTSQDYKQDLGKTWQDLARPGKTFFRGIEEVAYEGQMRSGEQNRNSCSGLA